MIIRKERPNEFSQKCHLVKTAFETAKVSNGKEQDFVNQLRKSGNYIPELALVAEENGKLVMVRELTPKALHAISGTIDFESAHQS